MINRGFNLWGGGAVPVREYLLNGNLLDSSINQQHGTLSGTLTYVADKDGNAASALNFTGAAANYVTIPSWTFSVGKSISFWFYPSALSTSRAIIGNSLDYGGIYYTQSTGSMAILQNNGGGRTYNIGIFTTWTHLTCVWYSQSELSVFINGIFISDRNTWNYSDYPTFQRIGRRQVTSNPYNGQIDAIRFFDEVLSGDAIQELYNS